MFRKLVSSLPFSPALVGQLGFYSRRLNKEQAARRLGLIFTVLAVIVQAVALIRPPEQTYAASPSNECSYNSALTKDDPNCKACPYNPTIWNKSSGCNANVTLAIDANNLSQSGRPADKGTANPGDRVQYNLHTTNIKQAGTAVAIQELISDLLEYSTVIDAGGGTVDQSAKTITWGTVKLSGNQTDTRSFVIQLNDTLAATPRAADNLHSYDCTLTSIYGNTLNIPLNCPMGKQIENTIERLPKVGVGANMLFSLLLVTIVTYLYIRSRQMNREINVIRREFNVG